MNRIVYYITNMSHDGSGGIPYKIHRQIIAFENAGYVVKEIKNFYKKSGETHIRGIISLIPFLDCRYDYKTLSNLQNVDCVYVRYYLCSYSLIKALKKLKKHNPRVKILVEIPTYPYDGERGFWPDVMKDKISRGKMHSVVDKIITFSDDDYIYKIPTIQLSNGVDLKKIRPRTNSNLIDGEIHVIAVATIYFWHGYDRLIEGMNLYYKNGGQTSFIVHLVGDGDLTVVNTYKEMVKKYNLDKRIIFYGRQGGAQLDEIYDKCSLAVDSLGRHRSKVFYNSSLKGKEYLAKGLPIISGVKTELDSDVDFHYYLRVPADDSPIDFEEVEKFYHKIYDNNDFRYVSDSIRKYCENNFSFDKTFQPVIDEMNKK